MDLSFVGEFLALEPRHQIASLNYRVLYMESPRRAPRRLRPRCSCCFKVLTLACLRTPACASLGSDALQRPQRHGGFGGANQLETEVWFRPKVGSIWGSKLGVFAHCAGVKLLEGQPNQWDLECDLQLITRRSLVQIQPPQPWALRRQIR